jgi:hypothetical protein
VSIVLKLLQFDFSVCFGYAQRTEKRKIRNKGKNKIAKGKK